MTDETGIYAIENLRDRRAYVGATKCGFVRRWGVHRLALIKGRSQVKGLQEDWDTHGSGWVKFVPLEPLSPDGVWGSREQGWIDRLRAEGYDCYNSKTGTTDRRKPWSNTLLLHPNYTLKEVATWAKITVPMVRAMIKRKELRAVKVGRLWRVTREDLDALLARGQSTPPTPPEPDIC